MVRVVSQNFSPPRSRHSSGETDWDLAERADAALSSLGKKRFELGFSECESSSDSFWDSEFDQEHLDDIHSRTGFENGDTDGNEYSVKSNVHSKRKERRRERNKISAQAYRKRKRQITYNQQQELSILQEKNKHLLELVNRLEKKTEKAKMHLRGISMSVPNNAHTDAEAGGVKGAPISASPPENAANSSDSQLNLNLNRNRPHQPSLGATSPVVGFHKYTEITEGALARNETDSTSLPNTNVSQLTSILINANSLVRANNNLDSNSFPPHVAFKSLVPVKSKHSFYNANLNYKSPILRPSPLQTVPEVPPCFLGELDDNSMPNLSTVPDQSNQLSQGDPGLASCKEEKLPCNSLRMTQSNPFNNSNNNLNNSKYDSANDNFQNGDTKNCDNHVQMNSCQFMNINGNFNQNAIGSKHEVHP